MLAIVGLIAFFGTLKEVVSHNPVVNLLIIAVLLISIIYSMVAAWFLFRGELQWTRLRTDLTTNEPLRGALRPLRGRIGELGHADAARRAVVIDALNESLEWRGRMLDYASGVLIGLGLLGTFVGLMHTMAGIKEAMAIVSSSGGKASATALIGGLTAPLAGMSTAFSASLLGLIGSLGVGALAQFVSRASSCWIESIREWAHLNDGDDGEHAVGSAASGGEAVRSVERIASILQSGLATLTVEARAGRSEQLSVANASLAALARVAETAERQQSLLGDIQFSLQANTRAVAAMNEAMVAISGCIEANRVEVSATVGSIGDTLIDIKTHTAQTVERLDVLQSGLTTKVASLEKMNLSLQTQRNAVLDCVEQIGRARVAIEGWRIAKPIASMNVA
ncbi:hypothetical protein PQR05_03475 [Paraburkholderia sediminicola]|uniref:hypothetical protein n=1 Tax=Paraburkholderia sediminicola TaxID=458836 RepID=UPI0038B9473D